MYRGDCPDRLTLDHVVPRLRGGDSVWENVVTACVQPPQGRRLPEEASRTLRRQPRPPAPVLFIRLAANRVPDTWRQYLPALEALEAAVEAA